MAIVAVLAALVLPSLAMAKEKARKTVCLSNLRQLCVGIQMYAPDYAGKIPYGPVAPPAPSPLDFYTSTGAPTSLISLASYQGSGVASGMPVALGLMLRQQLASQPKVLFCPASDQLLNADAQLAAVGVKQAQSGYYYRHAGNTNLFDTPGWNAVSQNHLRLDNLGLNRNGQPIRALVLDTQFLCPPALAAFNVTPSTHHQQRFVDILFSDGHAASRSNADGRYTVNFGNNFDLAYAFDEILRVFEQADLQP